jgi:hypothetical protein
MKTNCIYIFLFLFASCHHDTSCSELEENYNISINLLNQSLKDKGNVITREMMNNPVKAEKFYNKWMKIDSIATNVNSIFNDTNSIDASLTFVMQQTQNVLNLVSTFYNDRYWLDKEFESRLKDKMSFPTKKEILESSSPKKFIALKLLNNLEIMTDQLMRELSTWEDYYGRNLDTLNVRIRY